MTDTPPAAPTGSKRTTVPLEHPIRRGETTINEVTVRKPVAGELRGLNLQDLARSDVNALIAIIPRISEPTLIQQEVEALEVEDLAAFGSAVFDFFTTSAMRAQIETLLGT